MWLLFLKTSLKLEVNSLSLGQDRDVINGKMVLGEQKEIQEVKNAYAAYEKMDKIALYRIKSLKELHGIMTKYVVEESGDFRRGKKVYLMVANVFSCVLQQDYSIL